MSALNRLRTKRNKPTGIFAPSESYIIMAHGLEGERLERFIVPDNCIIIAKARPGDSASFDDVVPFYNIVGSEENHELFKNPLENTHEIINNLGSVVIYKPGDLCPNFKYTFASYDILELFMNETTSHWGLIQTPLKNDIQEIDISLKDTIKEWIPKIYSESILPIGNVVADKIIESFEFKEDANMDTALTEILFMKETKNEGAFFKFLKSVTYTQKDLLDIDEHGIARRPGVYYNFVCRNLHQLLKFKQNQNYMNYVESIKNLPALSNVPQSIQKRLLARRIIEAETKRKHLIPGTKYNKINTRPSGGNRTRKSRINKTHTRKHRRK